MPKSHSMKHLEQMQKASRDRLAKQSHDHWLKRSRKRRDERRSVKSVAQTSPPLPGPGGVESPHPVFHTASLLPRHPAPPAASGTGPERSFAAVAVSCLSNSLAERYLSQESDAA